jgi:ribonuclease HI
MFKGITTDSPYIQDMLSYIRNECREKEERSASYYNFDFLKGKPLEIQDDHARFEWTTISRHSKKHINTTSSLTLQKDRIPTPGRKISLFGNVKSGLDDCK